MTARDKIQHLHRRLGFGLTPPELAAEEKLGFDKSAQRLLDFQKLPDLGVSPYEFCWRNREKEQADVGSYRFRAWWTLRMVATERPLEEKLALFWHSHFAVGDNKVEDGPMMLYYLQTIYKHGYGKFEDLLLAISREPAMMRYLDMTRSVKGNPNENFAREVMELFTMGIGNYTEDDVKELSRALTGWGYIHTYYELPGESNLKLTESIQFDRPFASFAYLPSMRDETDKTILGQKRDWDGEAALLMLAHRPETARFVSGKLWSYFAGQDAPPKVLDRLVTVWKKSGGNIPDVVRAIALAPEFYAETVVGNYPKNPVDFVISIARKQGMGRSMMAKRPKDAKPTDEIPKEIMDQMGYAAYRMDRMGLTLLVPPDVAGWTWGENFINSSAMAERYQYQGFYYLVDNVEQCAATVFGYLKNLQLTSVEDITQKFAEYYDVKPNPETTKILNAIFASVGGVAMFDKEKEPHWPGWHFATLKYLVASPEMHLY